MGKGREPQIILKTDQRNVLLEMGLDGKLQARSSGWDENRTFLENDVLEVEYAMAAPTFRPRRARHRLQAKHYLPTEE